MGRRWRVLVAAPLLLLGLGAARDPVLVPDVSQHTVAITQGFTGAELYLFGAILPPPGVVAKPGDYDIAVVLEGPAKAITLREKKRVAGMWINADSTSFQSAPGFYAVAASRPIAEIVPAQTAAIYELGLGNLQLSPSGSIDPATQERFAAGLAGLMARHGLYGEEQNGVSITGGVLYRARIALPSSVPVGSYTAETFAISHGKVVASALARVEVTKQGFARAVADFARHNGLAYGLLTVSVSLLMGWVAGRLFVRD